MLQHFGTIIRVRHRGYYPGYVQHYCSCTLTVIVCVCTTKFDLLFHGYESWLVICLAWDRIMVTWIALIKGVHNFPSQYLFSYIACDRIMITQHLWWANKINEHSCTFFVTVRFRLCSSFRWSQFLVMTIKQVYG